MTPIIMGTIGKRIMKGRIVKGEVMVEIMKNIDKKIYRGTEVCGEETELGIIFPIDLRYLL